ncbi:MAG: methylated-DNA--[protein]-cysteine S-methyltransferase [Rhodothalassiaceae bacterium]
MTSWMVPSPFGDLLLRQQGEAIVALEWCATAPPGDRPTPLLCAAEQQLRAYFAGTLTRFSLPLDPAGTPLQRRIWGGIAAIPYGHQTTYGAIARQLGTIARVVGSAAAANPIPILIPCHRVLAADGHLRGYSGAGGVATKRALLDLETPRLDL